MQEQDEDAETKAAYLKEKEEIRYKAEKELAALEKESDEEVRCRVRLRGPTAQKKTCPRAPHPYEHTRILHP